MFVQRALISANNNEGRKGSFFLPARWRSTQNSAGKSTLPKMEFKVGEKKLLWNNVCRLTMEGADSTFLEVHTEHYPVSEGDTFQYHLSTKLSEEVLERCAYVMNGQFVSKADGKLCYSFGGLLLMTPPPAQQHMPTKHVVLGLETAY